MSEYSFLLMNTPVTGVLKHEKIIVHSTFLMFSSLPLFYQSLSVQLDTVLLDSVQRKEKEENLGVSRVTV